MTKLLPTITMLINIGSAIWYLSKGDYPRCVYWISAGIINLLRDLVDEMKLRTIADVERSNLGEGAKEQVRRSFSARPKQSK